MYYGTLEKATITDGPGFRVSLYVSGCRNACCGCHNPESHCFTYGTKFTEETISEILEQLAKPYIAGLTLCGGDPMEEENQIGLLTLVKLVKSTFPNKSIWCYTGYEWDELLIKKHCEVTDELLSYIDVMIVGRFILDKRDISDANRWRGSTNQRVIDVQNTLNNGKLIAFDGIPNNIIED